MSDANKEHDELMKFESILPADFDGNFRFTNYTDKEFIGKWGGKDYHYPPMKTSLMIFPEHSPLEIQHIRKKFAKDLAEREFFNSKKYETYRLREGVKDEMGMIQPRGQGMTHAGQYNLGDLTPYIQQALKPLPIARASVVEAKKEKVEDKLSRNEEGELNTEAIDQKKSLRDKALKA